MAQASTPAVDTSDLQRSVPAPFLTKTYQLVDDSSTDDIISWNECGSAFVVWRPAEFARDLLPNYFKHNNFSSFVRQLNTYGFKKIVPDRWEFANDCFRKGERHLLIDIHRRKTMQLVSVSTLPSKRSHSPTDSVNEQAASSGSSPLCSPTERTMFAHSDESERLKKENMLLSAELSCLRRLCTDLVLYIQNHAGRSSAEVLGYITGSFSSNGSHENAFNKRVISTQVLGNDLLDVKVDLHADREDGQRDPPKLFGVPLLCRRDRLLEHQSREHGPFKRERLPQRE
eukprot:c4928_g1_i1 orf=14-871(+)